MNIRISVFGLGVFGYALTYHISNNLSSRTDASIRAFDISPQIRGQFMEDRTHPAHPKTYVMPENVTLCDDPKDLIDDCEVLLLAIPGQEIREAVRSLPTTEENNGIVLVNMAKSLEIGTGYRMSQVVSEELSGRLKYHYVQLSGGMFAEDILKEYPLGVSLACEDIDIVKGLKERMFGPRIKIHPTTDVTGVEYAGALKNIIAILAGISNGLGFSIGSETFLISKASREIGNFAISRGAKPETFEMDSQAWGNDLWMTCFGKSRNKRYGVLVGKGTSPKEVLKRMKEERQLVEGYYTLKTLFDQVKGQREDFPIISRLYDIIYNEIPPNDVINEMMQVL